MQELPKVLELMKETNLPIERAMLDNGKVIIYWSQQPQEHEKELAQRCTHFQVCIHKW